MSGENWRGDGNWRKGPARPTFDFTPYNSPIPLPGPSNTTTTPVDDPISEGRRISLGNLNTAVNRKDIEAALKDAGIATHEYKAIRIPEDPFKGGNKGFCSVDFVTREAATAVLEKGLKIQKQDRPLKVERCEPTKPGSNLLAELELAGVAGEAQREEDEQTGRDFEVKLGGLGPMPETLKQHNWEISGYFRLKGLKFKGNSKTRCFPTPDDPTPGCFCYIFFETREDAQRAIDGLDGQFMPGRLLGSTVVVPTQLTCRMREKLLL